MTAAGIILAAGESSRMGSDKALLPYSESTFLGHLVRLFRDHVSPVVVVLGHNAAKIRESLDPGVKVAVNSEYRRGQLSSLQAGIRALPPNAPAALVTLVDHPAVSSATIETILQRVGSPLTVPSYHGRRGHPVLFSRALLDEILFLPPEASAKQIVRAHLNAQACLDLDDPGILRDIDTPEDYQALTSLARRR